MIQSTYKYRFDRRTIYWSLVHLGVFVLLGVSLYVLYEGGYLSAWFTSFVGALIALMALSIPRKIVVTEQTLQVRCLLDITEIRRDEIASVRRVDTRRMKGFIPIFGGYGFFGYYGHFIDLRRLDRVRIYASKWGDFVEITDIYEERLYVSCDEADRLVAELTPPGGNRPDEEAEEEAEEEASKTAEAVNAVNAAEAAEAAEAAKAAETVNAAEAAEGIEEMREKAGEAAGAAGEVAGAASGAASAGAGGDTAKPGAGGDTAKPGAGGRAGRKAQKRRKQGS
ncbi:PH domain-containing protein [uncultured Alistipes sp.]|uniref:PH domain-containing protein n=1 Tax=uncultured Alistipes sp. TaxID=538949 RepID=UPI00260D9E01|nr:PH domain-containing protein [uncultured Alistipes sp.]